MTFTDAQLARVPHPLQALHYDGCALLKAHRNLALFAATKPAPHEWALAEPPECDCGGRIE